PPLRIPDRRWLSVFRRWLVKTVARRCDRLTVPSPSMIQAAHALGVPEDRLRLIPWGIETDIFTPTPNDRAATRAELGIGAADTVILCPRGLAAVYNIDVVLRAVNSVTGLYPNLRLALLHFNIKPAYLKKLQAAVAQLGLEKTVLWLPPQDTAAGMARLYRMADIVISIPSSEGYGFTVFEAMAAGCPTIISDLPAFRGQLEHGLHTLKVPPRSVRAAAAALTDLLAAAALRRTLRQNGLTLCRAQSIATRIAKTDALYKGLTA
ncbi:MAG: glycosyltransferase family 4 protein, partial [Anaerolineae bacterium]